MRQAIKHSVRQQAHLPQTFTEAEGFLWRSMDHLRESERREKAKQQDVPANTLLYGAIKKLQVEQEVTS